MTCALVKPTSGYRTFSRLVSLSVRFSIWTSTEVSLATFAHHLFGRLVDPDALESRRAQLTAARPLDELELGHDLRLDEVRRLRRFAYVKRILVRGERLQLGVQLVENLVGEAGPNLPGVDELPVFVVTDEQRARMAAPLALAVEPARDHQLLAVAVLDLQPCATAPSWLIARVELLGHDAFEPGLGARVLHRLAAAHLVGRRLP